LNKLGGNPNDLLHAQIASDGSKSGNTSRLYYKLDSNCCVFLKYDPNHDACLSSSSVQNECGKTFRKFKQSRLKDGLLYVAPIGGNGDKV
ncbi:hypothetical protein DID76_04310, partial [Candidatus Marinamargulisbacteria bacterium SCGC AG-414-C22]